MKIHEPVGVIGIACPDQNPLLSFVSLFAPAVIRGNTVVIVPSEKYPLSAMGFYQVRHRSQIWLQLSVASLRNKPQSKDIIIVVIIKLKLWLTIDCKAKVVAKLSSRPEGDVPGVFCKLSFSFGGVARVLLIYASYFVVRMMLLIVNCILKT